MDNFIVNFIYQRCLDLSQVLCCSVKEAGFFYFFVTAGFLVGITDRKKK